MKLNASTKDLRDVIARLSNIPGAVTGSPVTQAVRFEADLDGLKLTRFSSESRITITLEAASIEDEEGVFSVDHTALTRMTNQLPAKEVTLENDEKLLHFVSGKAKAKLSVITGVESEAPEPELETENIRLPVESLVAALNFAAMAMHQDESQGGFNGVCLRMIRDKLAFVATDKRWVHAYFLNYTLPVDCVVSANTVGAILKAVGKQAGACTFAIGENAVSLVAHDADMNFALFNAAFPNVEPMIFQPESSIKSKVRICRVDFIEALKTASGIVDDAGRFVKVNVTKDKLTIHANNEKDSEMVIELNCMATAEAEFIIASTPIHSSLENFNEHEEIEIILYPQTICVRESTKVAVFALRVQ